jgi:hypothetical protein
LSKGDERLSLETEVEGDFIYDLEDTLNCQYPFVNGEWYPRHGYLMRSQYEISFLQNKKFKSGRSGRTRKRRAGE